MRVCLIGVGAIGGLHLEAYEKYRPDIYIGVVESDVEKQQQISGRVNCVYGSIEAAFVDGYDLYDIALPTFLHYRALNKILSATNSLLLCEKPLVLNEKELYDLIQKFKDFDSRVKCAFVERFNEPFYMAKQWTEAQTAPYEIKLVRRTKKPQKTIWINEPSLGGDIMLDLGIHDIDAAIWWTKSTVVDIEKHECENDRESVVLVMADGSRVTLAAGWDLPENHASGIVNTFEMKSRENYFSYDTEGERITYSHKSQLVTPRFPAAYYNEIDAMLGKRNDLIERFPSLNDLIETMRIITLIQEDRK